MVLVKFLNKKIDDDKTLRRVLTEDIVGLGTSKINYLCFLFRVKNDVKIKNLNLVKLRQLEAVARVFFQGLRFKNYLDRKFTIKYVGGSYKEIRLRQGLPVNGQRTRSNARTAKSLNLSRASYLEKLQYNNFE